MSSDKMAMLRATADRVGELAIQHDVEGLLAMAEGLRQETEAALARGAGDMTLAFGLLGEVCVSAAGRLMRGRGPAPGSA